MKKVLYISYDGMTDPLGQSQVLPYIAGLTKKGYTFHLISFEKHDRYLKHKNHIQKYCDQNGISWHPQDYHTEGGLKKTIRQVRRMNKVAVYLQKRHQFSIVHCRSYIAALAGLKLKRMFGVKMLFDMRGFWANERVDGKIWNLDSKIYRTIYNYFKRKEIQFFKKSDYTISLTTNGMNEIRSWEALNGADVKIKVIPCCVNLELFDPTKIDSTQKSALKNSLNINETDFILGYVGSIGTWYMLPEMLGYFKVLKSIKANAKFLFVTGEKPEYILEEVIKKDLKPDDFIITSVLHDQVPIHISLFDQSVFFIRPSYSKKASSPTKQGEIMAMGVPLVCNSGVGDTDEIVLKYNSGKVISEFTDEEYRKVIEENTVFDSEEITKGAKDYFALEEGVNRYLSVYKAIDD
ncbi:MAG: glycosyltransferase [Crocinitomicaceae bacterium]